MTQEPSDNSPSELTVTRDGITIGRGAANGLNLPGDTISQRHCQMFWKNSMYFLQDVGSTHGTFFRVGTKRLEEGDIFELGSVEVAVRKVYFPAKPAPLTLIKSISVDLLFSETQEPGQIPYVSLQVTKDGVVRKECELVEDATVGRKLTCSVSVPEDDHMSGTHCRIFQKEGAFWIEDMKSMNG